MGSKYVTSIGGGGYEGNHEKSFKDFAKKNKSPHSKALERKKGKNDKQSYHMPGSSDRNINREGNRI